MAKAIPCGNRNSYQHKEISPFDRLSPFAAEQEHAFRFFISEGPCQVSIMTPFMESIFPQIAAKVVKSFEKPFQTVMFWKGS